MILSNLQEDGETARTEMSNFGASFKKAREAAGLSLETIAEETRISTRFLLAIETEEFQVLPGGIFNRGFIRAYALRIGIDADQAVADYERLSAAADPSVETLRNAERASTRKTEKMLYPAAAALLLVLVAAYYLTRPAAPVIEETPAAEESAPAVAAALPEPVLPATTEETAPAVETAPAPEPAPAPPPAAAIAALVVDLDVTDVTWIQVLADGERVLSDNVEPGATRRFTAQSSLDILIGNAAGATLKVNGRDFGPLGRAGQVREIRITPENAATIKG
jgi:cytoskeletal protein RodZ